MLDLCVICLENNENLSHLHDINNLLRIYSELIDNNDVNSSIQVCPNCEEKLQNIYDFKILCQTSYQSYQTKLEVEANALIAQNELKSESDFMDHDDQTTPPPLSDAPQSIATPTTTEAKPVKVKRRTKLDKCTLCNVCGKQFRLASQLRRHQLVHADPTQRHRYQCSMCSKSTTSMTSMRVHQRTHTGEKPHVCEFCGRGFAQTSTLKIHRLLHTGRSINCTVCNQLFARQSELRQHMRRHTGEMPYICEICKRGFYQRSHLTGHMVTHSDVRPFVCTICGKAFKVFETLRKHEQIHTGERDYKCSKCGFCTSRAYNLKIHLKTHQHEEEEEQTVVEDGRGAESNAIVQT